MPIFEYRCNDCDAVTEVLVRCSGDEDRVKCEECGSTKVEKMLSAAAVAVKNGPAGGAASCGREVRCCGRTTPCDAPPCQES